MDVLCAGARTGCFRWLCGVCVRMCGCARACGHVRVRVFYVHKSSGAPRTWELWIFGRKLCDACCHPFTFHDAPCCAIATVAKISSCQWLIYVLHNWMLFQLPLLAHRRASHRFSVYVHVVLCTCVCVCLVPFVPATACKQQPCVCVCSNAEKNDCNRSYMVYTSGWRIANGLEAPLHSVSFQILNE